MLNSDIVGKIKNKLDYKSLASLFKYINQEIVILDWCPLVGDECEKYADTSQPIIKVFTGADEWLRVYVDNETKEVTWY